MTASPTPSAEAAARPNQIVFAPGAADLSEAASAKLAKLAETAKKSSTGVRIATSIESRPDRADQMELARKRTGAVRQALEAAGIPLARMRIDIADVALGLVAPADANGVVVELR